MRLGNFFALGSITSTNFGSTTDQIEPTLGPPDNAGPFDGNSLIGLTFNPKVVDPFNGNLGVLMSYDNAPSTPLVTTQDTVFVNDRLRISQGDVFAVYTNQSDISDSITFQHITINPDGSVTSDAYSGSIGSLNTSNKNVSLTAPVSGGGYLGRGRQRRPRRSPRLDRSYRGRLPDTSTEATAGIAPRHLQ